MENNQTNSPQSFSDDKGKGTENKPKKITPAFDDLNNPAAITKHVEQLKKTGEAEQELNQNPFPVEVFPEPIQEIIAATNESLNFPIDFIGASILYAASVSIGNTHRVELMKGWQESAIIYLAIVGRPGTNKTHPLKWALKPIEHRDNLNFAKYTKEMQEFEAMATLSKKDKKQHGNTDLLKPNWKQHLISDFTPEALTSVHSFNKRGLGVNVDELASWFKNFNRYNKGSEQEFWLSAWSGNTIKINRKTSEQINIPLPFIPVAGTIQPGVLNELAKNRTKNGFLDRILYAMMENLKKEYWSEKELSPVITESWHKIISYLLDIPIIQDETGSLQPEILRFTPEAKELLSKWQIELTDQSNKPENEPICGIYAKLEVYAIRLSLILQMLRHACNEGNKQAVELESVQGALRLVEYFKKTAIKVHSIVSNASPLDNLPTDKQTLYIALPENFATNEGVKVAKNMGMAERTFKRFLNDRELFDNPKRGEYEKRY